MECEHHLCLNCFSEYRALYRPAQADERDTIHYKCEVCLKSQRVVEAVEELGSPLPTSNNGRLGNSKTSYYEPLQTIIKEPHANFATASPFTRDPHFFNKSVYKTEGVENPKILIREQAQKYASFKNTPESWPVRDASVHALPGEELFCFTCMGETFSMNAYLQGQHKNHRVKTYDQAFTELRDHHIKTVSLLQHKSEELQSKQYILEGELGTIQTQYNQSVHHIEQYYNQIIERIHRKRSSILYELDQCYKVCSSEIKRAVDNVRQNLFQIRNLTITIKEFALGNESINTLVAQQAKIKKYSELRNARINPTTFSIPKLVESFDLGFHIENSLRLSKETGFHVQAADAPAIATAAASKHRNYNQMYHQATTNTDLSVTVPRKVKLTEKLRSKMNPISDLIFR